MLSRHELARVAADYGAAENQIRRDHLISHVLHALAELDVPLVFFGGTALARTHLTTAEAGGRLSEDIDLLTGDRRMVAGVLDKALPRRLRREFPRSRWEPAFADVGSVDAAQLVTEDGLRLRIQLIDTGSTHADWNRWPTEVREIDLRYGDVPGPVRLRVPTLDAFAGMKIAAYADRRAPRDLFDLAALARLDKVTDDVPRLVRDITGITPGRHHFRTPPVMDWEDQLAHQTGYLPTAQECMDTACTVFGEIFGWPEPYDPFT
ncbi:nucleotidyl transferase AbiEii/AbiGii toxin family protein [Streptomyces sp. NBC_00483]|uniref:nucleotidyl transferase AbiEii/AbiGii toxin family protein n=1 Tax=Streptomyces sp. NBC_00483 TaxID=2975756 RepID=UPI002E16C8A4